MENSIIIQGLGLAASILLAISIMMKNVKWLRVFNLIGSFTFALYGFLILSYSVIFLNIFSFFVNAYYLAKMRKKDADIFETLFVNTRENASKESINSVARFFRFYDKDIVHFFPSFIPDISSPMLVGTECYFILRETLPVALIIFRREPDNTITILLDYVIPSYRDFKNADYFFNTIIPMIARPGTILYAKGEVSSHRKYLKKMKFEEAGNLGKTIFFKKIV
jgi:hypothetical protein